MKKVFVAHTVLSLCCVLAFHWSTASADATPASDFVSFTKESDRDCEEKGGLRVFVHNRHEQKIIDLQLDRYFSGVRQGGRSMFALAAGKSQPMGCSYVLDAEQSWQMISAEFISAQKATSRYGEIVGSDIVE